jgi:hypothetical protein
MALIVYNVAIKLGTDTIAFDVFVIRVTVNYDGF